MAVPDFNDDGYLDAGTHRATPDEVKAALVSADRFAGSSSRTVIFEGWTKHREALRYLVVCERQWLGGSFVSSKLEPGDLDLCSFVNGEDLDALSSPQFHLVDSLLAGPATKGYWSCDSYAVLEYPEEHPLYAASQVHADYWRRWWGHNRDGDERGFLEVT